MGKKTIRKIVHRDVGQKPGEMDLVLEVGKRIPQFYLVGRASYASVVSIKRFRDLFVCTLSTDDFITVGRKTVKLLE